MNNDLAPRFRSFSSAFARPLDKAIRAVSDAEKKAEKNSRITKHMPPNIIFGLRYQRYFLKTEVQILLQPTVIFSLRVKHQKICESIFSCSLSKDCNITVDLMLSANYRQYLGQSSCQCLPLEKLENTFFQILQYYSTAIIQLWQSSSSPCCIPRILSYSFLHRCSGCFSGKHRWLS